MPSNEFYNENFKEDKPVTNSIESDEIVLIAPTKRGYNFEGWYDAKYGGNKLVSIKKDNIENKDFYARWSDPIEYMITYHLNGGSGATNRTYNIETPTLTLPTPQKLGYIFLDWYDNPKFTGSAVTSVEKNSTGNKSFYAKWVNVLDTISNQDFVFVPGGTYIQTPTSGTKFTHTISSFQIAKYQVTYELWYAVREWAEQNDYIFSNKGREGSVGGIGTEPTVAKYEPVTEISWIDCIVWCNAYSEMSGLTTCYKYNNKIFRGDNVSKVICDWNANGYRLPSEGEWQYVASNKGITPYDWASGDITNYKDDEACKKVAWGSINSGGKTQPVGGKRANELGIFDMSGNLYEWCWDWYGSYPGELQTDYRGPSNGSTRVRRGGGWNSYAIFLQVGYRSFNSQNIAYDNVGFRLARSVIDLN